MKLEYPLLALCAGLALCAPVAAADDSFSAGLVEIDERAVDDGRLSVVSGGLLPERGMSDARLGLQRCAPSCDTAAPSTADAAHPVHTLILAGLGAVGFVVRRRRVL